MKTAVISINKTKTNCNSLWAVGFNTHIEGRLHSLYFGYVIVVDVRGHLSHVCDWHGWVRGAVVRSFWRVRLSRHNHQLKRPLRQLVTKISYNFWTENVKKKTLLKQTLTKRRIVSRTFDDLRIWRFKNDRALNINPSFVLKRHTLLIITWIRWRKNSMKLKSIHIGILSV